LRPNQSNRGHAGLQEGRQWIAGAPRSIQALAAVNVLAFRVIADRVVELVPGRTLRLGGSRRDADVHLAMR
jgi:hypothetical protein